MSTPRRPSAGRPSAGRRPARAGARPARASSRPPAGPAARSLVPRAAGTGAGRANVRPGALSPGRVAVLLLVAVTLLVSAALPVRELVRQRGQIAELAQSNADARARVAELQAERARQQDPAHVMAEARRRLHFVLPGETMYVVLEPAPTPAQEDGAGPWWSQLWDTVESADRPQAAGAEPSAPAESTDPPDSGSATRSAPSPSPAS